ncbi:MAG: antibiotic biosynthesis monooxygenase [Bacteroidetes bacterium]|nr:antibiotic biosynthesis monooxygenase [Bacteroidota bacterium]MCY4233505.1 antibiotic biosynthesis monooxygenase [Bacteroidota bacterium]
MLLRLVRLTVQSDAGPLFLERFETIAPRIRQASGCLRLELWVDNTCHTTFTTYSEWDSESSLNAYIKSDVFKENWRLVKPLFAAPAVAHSYHQYQHKS